MGRINRFERFILFAFCLNAIDIVLTLVLTYGMGMIEANPIMAALLSKHALLFTGVKLGAVSGICVFLWRRQKEDTETGFFAVGVVVGMLSLICFWQTGLLLMTIIGP